MYYSVEDTDVILPSEDIERFGIGYFYVAFYYLSWYTFNNHYIPNNRKGEGICDT